jgi:glycerophosphoryl diester phosphodiesterase
VIPRRSNGNLARPTTLVTDAHAQGLAVHPWTFRAENAFLPAQFRAGFGPGERGDLQAELFAYLSCGIDGFFIDQADLGVAARHAFLQQQARGQSP